MFVSIVVLFLELGSTATNFEEASLTQNRKSRGDESQGGAFEEPH